MGEHRLFLIHATVGPQGAVDATVLGHTGNVYDLRLGARIQCSCPDFVKTKRVCKHIVFLFLRVLSVPRDDPRVWQRALLPQEMRDLRERLEKHFRSSQAGGVQAPSSVVSALDAEGQRTLRQPLGEQCSICFDLVHTLVGSICCAICGYNFHTECLDQWRVAAASSVDVSLACPRW